jgi:uncharacterized protein (TIGR02147 family)
MWANRLGYRSSRSLELVLSGNRPPSDDMCDRLAKDLALNLIEQKYFKLMIKRERYLRKHKAVHDIELEMKALRPKDLEANFVSNEVFSRVSEWYYLVIRQLALTPSFQKNIEWIKKKLRQKVNSSQATEALAEWENLAFDRKSLYTLEDIPSPAVRTFHKNILYKAVEALDDVSVDEREFISITFRSSKNKIPLIKKKLRQLRDELNEELTDENGNEVFQLSMVLFPHSDLKS